MKFTLPLAALLPLLLSGCASTTPNAPVGIDVRPEGPGVKAIRVSSDGAKAIVANGRTFSVIIPVSGGKPAAIFSFKDTDINDRMGMALDVKNYGREPVRVYADLNGDNWVRGYVTVVPDKTATLYIFARRKNLSEAATNTFPRMHGIPGGKMSLWSGVDEPVVAKTIKLFVVVPKQEMQVEVSNIRPFGSSPIPTATNFFPFIDQYGQYNHKDWPGKTHADADFKTAKEQEDADLAQHQNPQKLDQYGGWAGGPLLKATGHFRVEKYGGKWWFVDPDGRLFWSDGLDCVGFNQSSTRIQGRERFYENPAAGNFLAQNLQAKFGDDWRNVASDRLLQRLQSWGLNTMGGGADRGIVQKHRVPYTIQLSTRRSGFGGGPPDLTNTNRFGFGEPMDSASTNRLGGVSMDPTSTNWVDNVRQMFTRAAQTIKDDPWCIGFFVDNEIHASTNPAWFESYYRQVGALAKEILPGTLYLGSRLDYHNWPDDPPERFEIVRAASKYCDVISFNFYKYTLDDFILPDGVDKPVIIGEFHMGALDRGMFHTGLRAVIDQNQRAEGYRDYVTSALQSPYIVGAHWFQCYDEATTGRFDGENYQIGFLDICDTPYWETIAAARDVGYKLYSLRADAK
jgi:hypothetical protein